MQTLLSLRRFAVIRWALVMALALWLWPAGSSQAETGRSAPPKPKPPTRSYLPMLNYVQPAPNIPTPAWTEPQALNIVNLVGQVPDAQLKGAIISASGSGLVLFESSSIKGGTVTIRTTAYGRWQNINGLTMTTFGCLGTPPGNDALGSVAPPMAVRLYENGNEISDQVQGFSYWAGDIVPPEGAGFAKFTPRVVLPPTVGANGIELPAARFCSLYAFGDHSAVSAVFTFPRPVVPPVHLVGSQSSEFHSYIGPGDSGRFQPLMQQMLNSYGTRGGYLPLQIPPDANYFLLIYTPTPVDGYNSEPNNAARPGATTVRLGELNIASALSTDYIHSGAFPLSAIWQDADQAPGSLYLPLLPRPDVLNFPEMLVLPDVPYDPCFTAGTCSPAVLQRLYEARSQLTILYLRVDGSGGAVRVPLRAVGPAWQPGTDLTAATGCPCGWFTAAGTMIGLTP